MPILYYSAEVQMAVADDPMFPLEETIAAQGHCFAEHLVIQECQTYFVKFYGDNVPSFFPEPDAGLYTQRRFPSQLYEISFRNAVGLTRIGPVSIRVANRKIGEALYEQMLCYLADKFSNLIFSFGTTLGQSYRKEKPGRDIAYLEYLFLKKFLLDASPDLDGISALISANPHHRLFREFSRCSIDLVSNSEPAMLMSLFTGGDQFALLQNGHSLLATNLGRTISGKTGRNLYPTQAVEERKHLTVDTNENRFVKHFLQSVPHRLKELRNLLPSTRNGYLNPDIFLHLGQMEQKIASFLADPLWHDVGKMSFVPVASQVLQRREGYRQLFQLYSLLQLASRCDFSALDDFKNLIETKDTPTLFEYWSFFAIKEILDGLLKVRSCSGITSDTPLEQRVQQGLCIQYEGDVHLWFNKGYSGSPGRQPGDQLTECQGGHGSYSHGLRPDIVLGKGDKLLIFDAKYKGKGGGFYCESEEGAITSWKDDDIDKMHCYREAIKGVTGAFILYPGNNAVIYPVHGTANINDGVGALPLKPEKGARPVQRHLEDIRQIIVEFISES